MDNLIYNGNFSNQEGWRTSSILSISNNTLTINGSYQTVLEDYYIPVNRNDTYKIELDRKGISGTSYCYICIHCYDKYKNEIGIASVEHTGNTTLARDLNNGDTVVYLTSVASWYTSQTYRYVGICDDSYYGYARAIYQQKYDSSTVDTTNNTVTLQSAWSGGTWKAGTKVAAFTDGSTWVYPIFWTNSTQTDFVHSTGTFKPRAGSDFIRLGIICYNGNSYALKNIQLYNNTKTQKRERLFSELNNINHITKTGIINTDEIYECSAPIRYIRDYANGSDKNTASHWCEIQAIDKYGVNRALISNGTAYNTSGTVVTPNISGLNPNNQANTKYNKFHMITDGITTTNPYLQSCTCVQIDLGDIFDIYQIKVWHYWGDNRIYNDTKTQVSSDGQNWITIFDSAIEGKYVESSTGHIMDCDIHKCLINNKSQYYTNNLIEY